MPDHSYYDELVALAAGGHLSREEHDELRDHLMTCVECRQNARSFNDLVSVGLPLVHDSASLENELATDDASAGTRERFLERARREGVQLSPEVDAPAVPKPWSWHRVAAGLAAAAVLLLALTIPNTMRRTSDADADALNRARSENAQLAARLLAREQELAAQQTRVTDLQAQLATAARTANSGTRAAQVPGFPLGQSVSQEARLLEELQNRDRQLAEAADEISRINQLRVTDRADLDAQKSRVKEAFDQLRIANATIDMERQLADAGRDLLQLMLAKQLRVVDVRDTDANGRPGAAFARVFVADGRSIRIFAFDMNEGGAAAPRRFQVWGEQLGDPASVRSLGVLDVDDRTQNRWSLTIQDADVVGTINSVFVTTAARGGTPDGPRQLYALLGK